jgi:hypothetical protein
MDAPASGPPHTAFEYVLHSERFHELVDIRSLPNEHRCTRNSLSTLAPRVPVLGRSLRQQMYAAKESLNNSFKKINLLGCDGIMQDDLADWHWRSTGPLANNASARRSPRPSRLLGMLAFDLEVIKAELRQNECAFRPPAVVVTPI